MTTHTPGPWEVIASTSFPGRYLIAQPRSETPVLAVAETIQVPEPPEEKANARLIAAAPDLLSVLVEIYEAGNLRTALGVLAESAIAKASGSP